MINEAREIAKSLRSNALEYARENEYEIARQYQEKAKKAAIEEHKTRDLTTRLQTAEALAKAGVISKQDLENIKKEDSFDIWMK